MLACCPDPSSSRIGIDVTWVRAALAETSEQSTYTSAKKRIDAW